MNIVHLCSNDKGGAANAARRLHYGLCSMGVDSRFISKYSHTLGIGNHISFMRHKSFPHILNYGLEKLNLLNKFPPAKGYSPDTVLFTSPHSILHPERLKIIQSADIVHLHWVSHFIDYTTFFSKIDKPIVWTLHDMNPFTGGCHYSGECIGYLSACEKCPQLHSTNQPFAAQKYFETKLRSLQRTKNLTVAAPSNWILNLSKRSPLLSHWPHHHIPYGINEQVFKVLNQSDTKQKWNVPPDKINLLFISHSLMNKMKGLDLLLEAFKHLNKERFHLTILGKRVGKINLNADWITYISYVENETAMTEIYNTADLYICPSLRDNFPNTILESLFCGTPVLAFKVEGIAEMLEEGLNGLYATEETVKGLLNGINSFETMQGKFERGKIHHFALARYSLKLCVDKYISLYETLLRS